jgi:hypothetical protein
VLPPAGRHPAARLSSAVGGMARWLEGENHPDLSQITWTIAPTGGLAGVVNGLAPAEEVRAAFTAWQHALGVKNVREAAIRDTGVTSLSGWASHGTVRVGLAAHVFGPVPDDGPAEGSPSGDEPTPAKGASAAGGVRTPRVDSRGIGPTTRPGQLQARPPSGTQQPEAPRPTQSY